MRNQCSVRSTPVPGSACGKLSKKRIDTVLTMSAILTTVLALLFVCPTESRCFLYCRKKKKQRKRDKKDKLI